MSKKQIRSRLENLFTELAVESGSPAEQPPADGPALSAQAGTGDHLSPLAGWSWEIDSDMRYIDCGDEASDAVRINARSFFGKDFLSFALLGSSGEALQAALHGDLPAEVMVSFEGPRGACFPVRMHILARVMNEDGPAGWRGFAQRLPEENTKTQTDLAHKETPAPLPSVFTPSGNGYHHPGNGNGVKASGSESLQPRHVQVQPPTRPAPKNTLAAPREPVGYAVGKDGLHSARDIWTKAGQKSLRDNQMSLVNAAGEDPAAIAVPLETQGIGSLLLEIVDDSGEREWSEDDRFLVMEVASQLALALDNAQLYLSVQQELAERIRAEQAILRRNKDLSALNRAGQQLSRLASREEIIDLLSNTIRELLNSDSLYIALAGREKGTLAFPVCLQNGQSFEMTDRPGGMGIPEYVMKSRQALLISRDSARVLGELGIPLPSPLPTSLLAIPMIAGERAAGTIVVQHFEQENYFDEIHVELLSTVASQATTALENADLFEQMQNALRAIENRERYQANVARSAATLTEFGTKSMPEVLKSLGTAAQCSRVYFAQIHEDERGFFWSAASEWSDPAVAYLFDKTRILHMPVSAFPSWAKMLRKKGWVIAQSGGEGSAETPFLNSQHIRTTLLLSVPGDKQHPSFLAFDQLGAARSWLSEEINALRVGADAIANTFVREGLLDQLQQTLDETEGLYKASNRLAIANDMQEMVGAVLSSVRSPEINRAVMLLFEHDSYGKLSEITVGANWYSGRGTPPPPVGTEYLRSRYERFLQTTTPLFFSDISEAQIEKELLENLLHQKIRALAVLPLWSGKRQIGALALQSETRHTFTGRETRTYPPLVDQMAISVENQRLFEQTQVALSETELLYNVSNRIAQSAGARDMLSLVVETILPRGAEQVSLALISSDENGELTDIEFVGNLSALGDYQTGGAKAPVSTFPLARSLTDEPLIITDLQQHPLDLASRQTLEGLGMMAGCIVPLRSGGRLTGLLCASSSRPTEFSKDDTRLLRVVANGIAVALEKQRLLSQAQRRALELQTASEIARDTASTLSLDLLLKRIVEMLVERFNFHHASIFLLDETRQHAVVRESTGAMGSEIKEAEMRFAVGSRSVVGTVTSTGESAILHDSRSNTGSLELPMLPGTRSEMGIPLKLGSTVIGALDLHSRETNAFNQDDVTVLQILADQIAIAIENARAYELSQKAIADMKEVDRVKSQFLANMSHELRTPLNSIIGFSRVILKGIDGPINDTQKTDLSAIYNSGQHLLSLITDILDLSKIEAGKMELAFSDVNLADLINSAMSTAVGLVKDKPIHLSAVVPENMPAVRADSTRVRQVLINFLSNAAKFTDQGTITVEAQYADSPEGKKEVMVTVTDTGPGIAAQDQGKLFLPFSQVDDSPTRKTGGTGLGLSICRSLIEMHGGRIGLLRSEVGIGSTFFFTLPLSAPAPQPEPSPFVDGEEGCVVLAIDDDPKVIRMYERYLKPNGYIVVPLSDPKQAVEQVKAVRPMAVTLDVMMPEKDGWEVLRDLKNDPETRRVPIIMCSILENQEKGFSMGAADYLVKPFLQEDMINALNRLNLNGAIREVLVIDDDPADIRLVQKMLEVNPGYHVTAAEGGKQGWDTIQQQRPDAVILDLFMPDMNGFAVIEKLRSDPALRHIPVIVLTGADLSPDDHRQLTDFGQGVIAKGYLREKELLVSLEEALRAFRPAGPRTEQ